MAEIKTSFFRQNIFLYSKIVYIIEIWDCNRRILKIYIYTLYTFWIFLYFYFLWISVLTSVWKLMSILFIIWDMVSIEDIKPKNQGTADSSVK